MIQDKLIPLPGQVCKIFSGHLFLVRSPRPIADLAQVLLNQAHHLHTNGYHMRMDGRKESVSKDLKFKPFCLK